MPSTQAEASLPSSTKPEDTPAEAVASPAFQLAQASRALWTATLGLMTAFMQTPAPAHRCLIARRIARNLDTLASQDCFDPGCRATFVRLALRWRQRSEQYAPHPVPSAPPRSRWFDLLS